MEIKIKKTEEKEILESTKKDLERDVKIETNNILKNNNDSKNILSDKYSEKIEKNILNDKDSEKIEKNNFKENDSGKIEKNNLKKNKKNLEDNLGKKTEKIIINEKNLKNLISTKPKEELKLSKPIQQIKTTTSKKEPQNNKKETKINNGKSSKIKSINNEDVTKLIESKKLEKEINNIITKNNKLEQEFSINKKDEIVLNEIINKDIKLTVNSSDQFENRNEDLKNNIIREQDNIKQFKIHNNKQLSLNFIDNSNSNSFVSNKDSKNEEKGILNVN